MKQNLSDIGKTYYVVHWKDYVNELILNSKSKRCHENCADLTDYYYLLSLCAGYLQLNT
jgi:hypothetical protein